jgi:hypothetical protein
MMKFKNLVLATALIIGGISANAPCPQARSRNMVRENVMAKLYTYENIMTTSSRKSPKSVFTGAPM